MLKRIIPLTITLLALLAFIPAPSHAGVFDGWCLGVGINQATENDADESFAVSLKWRDKSWQAGVDYLTSEDVGGVGENNFMFAWGAMLYDFKRPEWMEYGIFVGAGAGMMVSDDDLIDWPFGPFAVLGWDFSSQAGLEGKVGYFGDNMFGTAMFYWYFE